MDYVYVNGFRLPVIHEIRKDRLMGTKRGSVLIVIHNCRVPENVQRYLESRDIKLIRLD